MSGLINPILSTNSVSLDISVDHFVDPFYYETWFWGCVAIILAVLLIMLIVGKRKRKGLKSDIEANKESDRQLLREQSEE